MFDIEKVRTNTALANESWLTPEARAQIREEAGTLIIPIPDNIFYRERMSKRILPSMRKEDIIFTHTKVSLETRPDLYPSTVSNTGHTSQQQDQQQNIQPPTTSESPRSNQPTQIGKTFTQLGLFPTEPKSSIPIHKGIYKPQQTLMTQAEQTAVVRSEENSPILDTLHLSLIGSPKHRLVSLVGDHGSGVTTALQFVASSFHKDLPIIYISSLDFLQRMPNLLYHDYGKPGKAIVEWLGNARTLVIFDEAERFGGTTKTQGTPASPSTKESFADILTMRRQNSYPTWIGSSKHFSRLNGVTTGLRKALSYFESTAPLANPSQATTTAILQAQAKLRNEELRAEYAGLGKRPPQVLRGRALTSAARTLAKLHPAKEGLHDLVSTQSAGLTRAFVSRDVYTTELVRRILEEEGHIARQLTFEDLLENGGEYTALAQAAEIVKRPQIRILQCSKSSSNTDHLGAALVHNTATTYFRQSPSFAYLMFDPTPQREAYLREVLPEIQLSRDFIAPSEELRSRLDQMVG